jgi:dihydrofolate reductase
MKVTLMAVQSLDGFITRPGVPGAGFASAADRAHFRAALAVFDCAVLGRVTYESARTDGTPPPATGRRRVVFTRSPDRYLEQAVRDSLEFTADPPGDVLARLQAAGRRSCALLGGSQVHQLFLGAGLVDEIWLTVEARLFAGGTPLVAAPADVRLALQSHEGIGDDALLLKYVVCR